MKFKKIMNEIIESFKSSKFNIDYFVFEKSLLYIVKILLIEENQRFCSTNEL